MTRDAYIQCPVCKVKVRGEHTEEQCAKWRKQLKTNGAVGMQRPATIRPR